MHVDHLNDHKSDNRLDNLVASCPGCNTGRARHKADATMRERYAVWIEHDGVRRTLQEWAARLGITRQSLRWRLANGWPLSVALAEPRGKFGPMADDNPRSSAIGPPAGSNVSAIGHRTGAGSQNLAATILGIKS